MSKEDKLPLSDSIETIVTPDPLPEGTIDHLEAFFSSLSIKEYPNFDLTDPVEASKATQYANDTLLILSTKMRQIEALKEMLLTRSGEKKAD